MSGSADALVAEIEAAVRRGELVSGDRLPTVRALADERSLSATTVAAAYRRLRERGVVVGRARQGTTIAARPSAAPVRIGPVDAPTALLDAATGTPDPASLPDLGAALARIDASSVTYRDAPVDPALVGVATAWLGADGVPGGHLTVTSGAMDAIERVLDAVELRVGDRVAVEDPGHVPVHQLVRSRGLEPVPVRVDVDGPMLDPLAAALDAGVRAVIVTPRAHNPTGAALGAERAAAIDAMLSRHPDALVVLDDHAGAISGAPLHVVGLDRPRWAVVRSMAKAYGPDLRLAFVAGDERTVAAVDARFANGPGWVSHLLQRLALQLLDDPAVDGLVALATERYASRRARLVDALASEGVASVGRSGLNVWVPVDDEQSVVDALRVAGVEIRAGAAHRITSPPAVRITVASLGDDEIDVVAEALVRAVRARPSALV